MYCLFCPFTLTSNEPGSLSHWNVSLFKGISQVITFILGQLMPLMSWDWSSWANDKSLHNKQPSIQDRPLHHNSDSRGPQKKQTIHLYQTLLQCQLGPFLIACACSNCALSLNLQIWNFYLSNIDDMGAPWMTRISQHHMWQFVAPWSIGKTPSSLLLV